MAKKEKPKAGAKTKDKKKSVKDVAVAGAKKILGKDEKKTGKSRKKSALWYAKEIQRMKLKRKYEKIRLGVSIR